MSNQKLTMEVKEGLDFRGVGGLGHDGMQRKVSAPIVAAKH